MTAAHKLARTSNPRTSKDAADQVRHFASEHREQIMGVLLKHPEGLTVHEIATRCGLDAHAIGKRMNELYQDALVYVAEWDDGTEQTRASPSGRQARVWLANFHGRGRK